MKFSHISDIHIHNLKYHKEQKQVFEKVYEHLKANKVDVNILTGDLFHIKGNVTPEAYQAAADFLKTLADIAPTHIILGNHDLILSNKNRLDSVSPVVDALNHPALFLHKNSAEVIVGDNFVLNVMSIIDEQENWLSVSNPDVVNIGLYHGSVAGVLTDQNWVMTHGEIDVEKFVDFDYVLLGDIHKANQILDTEGRVRYAGSLCQNNFGDLDDKGFLIWDIKDKNKFTVEHIHIPNPKPFINLDLENDGSVPTKFACPIGSRIRAIGHTDLSSDKIKKTLESIRKKYKPESLSFQNKYKSGDTRLLLSDSIKNTNLRDEDTQKKLIKEYLKDSTVSDEILDEIYALNAKYNREAEANEEVSRNVQWRLKKLKWDNLFNYGEGNEIDFTKIKGTVGIFGKNFSGKSSIIDSLLFAIYNNTSKNIRKNLFVINQNKKTASCCVEIEVDSKIYKIERSLSRYTKKLKGEVTEEAKATVDFSYFEPLSNETISLNGVDGNETNKNIRKLFGTIEDFFATSMSSQTGALDFINEGSTRRKEIFAKFLDLEIFETKFKSAKEQSSTIKAALRRLENKNFDSETSEIKQLITENEEKTKNKVEQIEKDKTLVSELSKEIQSLEDKISKISSENIDIASVKAEIKALEETKESLLQDNVAKNKKIEESQAFIQKAQAFLSEFDIEDVKDKKQNLASLIAKLDTLNAFTSEQKKLLSIYKTHTEGLNNLPCGKTYLDSCSFIKEANEYLGKVDVVELAIQQGETNGQQLAAQIAEIDENKLNNYIEKFEKLRQKKIDEDKNIINFQLAIEKNKNALTAVSEKLAGFSDKLKFYEEHKDAIENKKSLIVELTTKKVNVENNKTLVKSLELELASLYKEHGSLEQKIETIKQSEKEKLTLEKQYAAYELFMRCMHSNGIAFNLIKKNLPVINQEIAKVLSNIVEFEVFFENTDNKLDIFIKHPKYDARPLENGSGAEKTLAAMAIRIALINITNMPKPNIFILDEPGTALDNDNMEGFIRILDLVKNYFDITVLISHIDQLKDAVDTNIEISRNEGFAFVNC